MLQFARLLYIVGTLILLSADVIQHLAIARLATTNKDYDIVLSGKLSQMLLSGGYSATDGIVGREHRLIRKALAHLLGQATELFDTLRGL